MHYQVFQGGKGSPRNIDLEDLYGEISKKDELKKAWANLTEEQVDNLLEQTDLSVLEAEVIEELFGKTRSKLAGLGAGAKAVGNNIGNALKQGTKAALGKYQTGDLQKGQIDPKQAAKQAQVSSMSGTLKKSLESVYNDLKNSVESLGLGKVDSADDLVALEGELAKYDPALAKGLKNTIRWIKWTYQNAGREVDFTNDADVADVGKAVSKTRQQQMAANPNIYK